MTTASGIRTRPHQDDALVDLDGEAYYAVRNVDRMPPFLMSVVSDGDRWMFVSSTGNLTAGRGDASCALFPYVTDDRLNGPAGTSGPVTALRISTSDGSTIWTPFLQGVTTGARTLYKSVTGNAVVFEETDSLLGLRFRYRWTSADRLGFVRSAGLVNIGKAPVRLDLVDGLVDILPWGLEPSVYQTMGNLTNAYKRSEVIDPDARLAVFSLESQVVDRPEPAEVLKGTVVWSTGLPQASLSVSPSTLGAFHDDRPADLTPLVTGRPGAYLLYAGVELQPGEQVDWHMVADVEQDQTAVTRLRDKLRSVESPASDIESSLAEATESLIRIMAPADALQRTGDGVATAHHFSNVTYNVMRGGTPMAGYEMSTSDFAHFVESRNRRVFDTHLPWFESLPGQIGPSALRGRAEEVGDPQLIRLCLEYLPFGFSRRHGDPSRPWNRFSIRVQDDAGNPILYFEGNWRDIFQNWEALSMSFPEYLPGMVSVFVNASTPDGFNPYRISRHGIDWETPDPDDPWANIGYWGDHQIVYLLKLIEQWQRYRPGEIHRLLTQPWFSYADVPYRLAAYHDMLRQPKQTIRFDEESAERAAKRVDVLGADGRLLQGDDGEVLLVTLAEKLLVPALAKLSNFVPGGGIWMNTQRPEWNDANNALVGHGLSMVTLCQLRRYVAHLRSLIVDSGTGSFLLSAEVAGWLSGVTSTLASIRPELTADDVTRKRLMDEVGRAFSDYRAEVYGSGFSAAIEVPADAVRDLCDAALPHLDHTIRNNDRDDGLYHSYNLLALAADGRSAAVEHLPLMLEGQVAVLESGLLSAAERAEVLEALFSSDLYRPDQDSFMLYPAHRLPSFLDKNVLPDGASDGNPLVAALVKAGDRSVVVSDADGLLRFNASFANGDDLEAALDRLEMDEGWKDLVSRHRGAVRGIYEDVFGHHGYTGRSGSMYAYEGIGSIYWHMVAKLLVAAQESAISARREGAPDDAVQRLIESYWRIRSGLGFNKTPAEHGAIPIDPYSHTPMHAGAQQPGMTGLVKEELLTRPLELGLSVIDGEIRFDPILLKRRELLEHPATWQIYDVDQRIADIDLEAGSLGFMVCQVPVIVSLTSGDPCVELAYADGTCTRTPGLKIDRSMSAKVFARTGEITRIDAFLPGEVDVGSAAVEQRDSG